MRVLLSILLMSVLAAKAIGQPVFSEVAESVGVVHKAVLSNTEMPAQGGAAWFDYNNDGWYDLFVTGGWQPDKLFRNNGDGTFTDQTTEAGLVVLQYYQTDGVTTGDVNRDGWDDILVTTFLGNQNHLLLNNGNGTFTDQVNWEGQVNGVNSFSCSFGDMNLDGWLDLYICNWALSTQIHFDGNGPYHHASKNYYFENNGNGSFTEKSDLLGLGDSTNCSLGVLLTDYDGDHDLDIYVANDFGEFAGNDANTLFINQYPAASFIEIAESVNANIEMSGMGVAKGDIDEDGDLDYYVTNMFNDVLLKRGTNSFTESLVQSGMDNELVWNLDMSELVRKTGWGVAFLDVDNDTDLDCITANGDILYTYPRPAQDSNKLFLNDGNGMFSNSSLQSGISDTYSSRALAYCDYDLDGDLDVFIGVTDTLNGVSNSLLYRNDSPQQNWLEVKASGVENNLNGIGAKVHVYVDGRKLIREIGGESSFNSQNWHVAHFGLGSYVITDSVDVIWPGGEMDRLYDVGSNQLIEVVEGQGLLITEAEQQELKNRSTYPNPFTNSFRINAAYETVELFEAGGSLITVHHNVLPGHSIDTSKLPAGTYLVKLSSGNGKVVIRKMVRQ